MRSHWFPTKPSVHRDWNEKEKVHNVNQFNSLTPYYLSSFQKNDSAFLHSKFHPYVTAEYMYSIDEGIDLLSILANSLRSSINNKCLN